MTSSRLADLTLAQVSEVLDGYGSSLRGEAEDAIHALLKALEAGLTGTLENAYHLSSIDPGLGKTLSVTTFLRTWKAQGFAPSSSVLIGLSRLAEIPKYLESAGLDREDVAIVTSDRDLNALGLPEDQHNAAPILFTTQQMIERRTRERSFAEASEFHYRGQPRSLRIWDESLIPATPLTIRVDELGCLPAALRHRYPELATGLQRFLAKLLVLEPRERVTVPGDFVTLIDAAKGTIGQEPRAVLDDLRRLSGRTVTLVDTGGGNMHMAGASSPLPSDFSPVVILDASGRVRETYRIWERQEAGQLRRLPEAVKDYSNLTVNLWERPVGKVAVTRPGVGAGIIQAIAEVIDKEDTERAWLIVSYLSLPLEKQLRETLKDKADIGDRLHFLHWGDHHGTNAFAHCGNVVLVGQVTHGPESYPAHVAACGAMPTARLEQKIKTGEYRHNLLQALTRASVRSSKGGLAGTCNAYVIASPGTAARKLLLDTFPGCSVDTWAPTGPEATGKAGELIAILEEAASRPGEHRLSKKDLRETLGIDSAPNFSPLLDHPAVAACIERLGINNTYHAIVVRGKAFEPYAGEDYEDGFTIADLEHS